MHQAGFDTRGGLAGHVAYAGAGAADLALQKRGRHRLRRGRRRAEGRAAAPSASSRSWSCKVRVLTVSGAKDPDEFIKAKGADAFQNLLEESENQRGLPADAVQAKYDLRADEQKVALS